MAKGYGNGEWLMDMSHQPISHVDCKKKLPARFGTPTRVAAAITAAAEST